jgi:hypothetical protein
MPSFWKQRLRMKVFLFMVTVKQALDTYCKDKGLPTPTGKDYKHAGRLINTHFRKYWGLNMPIDVINSVRYTLDKEEGIIVFEYPDTFLPEMFKRIEYFFSIKEQRMESVPKSTSEKKSRKRIPVKQKIVYVPKTRP